MSSIAVRMRIARVREKVIFTLLGADKREVSSTQISPPFSNKVDDHPVLADGPVIAIVGLLVLI